MSTETTAKPNLRHLLALGIAFRDAMPPSQDCSRASTQREA
jgi:hypothetical protein